MALVPYGEISVQRAATRADVNTSSHKSIFEKSHLLKWTLIMSESAPVKDNVHNFQGGHNGKHLIWWSLMKLHHQHLLASAIQPDLSGPNEKLQNPSSGRHLCKFTQKPNKTPYAHCFKGAENSFNERSNGKVCMQIPKQLKLVSIKCVHDLRIDMLLVFKYNHATKLLHLLWWKTLWPCEQSGSCSRLYRHIWWMTCLTYP